MNFHLHYIFYLICFVFLPATQVSAQGAGFYGIDRGNVTVCDSSVMSDTPPDFSVSGCKLAAASNVDPQGQLIWFKATVMLPATRGEKGEPLSLYLFGKMSSEIYLNGQLIGRNGVPGIDAESEIPGLMDSEFYPPEGLLRVGANEVVVKASAHHGYLTLGWPLHIISIGPSGTYANGSLPHYIPALVTLGLFVVGVLYFGTMAIIGTNRARFVILGLVCLFAAAQLVSEALRGLISYRYPVHDLRLISIALFSTGFGFSVTWHVFRTYAKEYVSRIMMGVAVLCGVTLYYTPSYDFKAILGMTVPLVFALIAASIWSFQRKRRAFVYFAGLLAFVTLTFAFEGLFLDTLFFFLVAFFLLLIFIEQAITLAEEARQRRSEEARADRLAVALEEASQHEEAGEIRVKSAGKIERIAVKDILHCRGMDGYAEIILTSGRTTLYTATLNDMEEELPASFLRVHRSHLINLKHVEALSRDKAGTGTLTLVGGVQVPVSRRIMPSVRQALA